MSPRLPNTHRHGNNHARFTGEGEEIFIKPGCYVDGGQYTLRAGTQKAAEVAFGVGAVAAEDYDALVRYVNAARTVTDLVDLGERIVTILNWANNDPIYHWQWAEGDLVYATDPEEDL